VRRLRTVFATIGIASAVIIIAPSTANAGPLTSATPLAVTSVTVVQPDGWGWTGVVSPDGWGWTG
jgi:hypothetical protein